MLNRKVSALALAATLTVGVIGVFAQDAFTPPATPQDAIAAREALMKENGGVLRSAGKLTGAEAVAAMTKLRDNYSHIPALFPKGSEGGDALPAIWENWEAFTAIATAGQTAAEEGIKAADAGDSAGYAAALKAVGGTCGQCHQQFRKD